MPVRVQAPRAAVRGEGTSERRQLLSRRYVTSLLATDLATRHGLAMLGAEKLPSSLGLASHEGDCLPAPRARLVLVWVRVLILLAPRHSLGASPTHPLQDARFCRVTRAKWASPGQVFLDSRGTPSSMQGATTPSSSLVTRCRSFSCAQSWARSTPESTMALSRYRTGQWLVFAFSCCQSMSLLLSGRLRCCGSLSSTRRACGGRSRRC